MKSEVEDINKKLKQEEGWLQNFQSNVQKIKQLRVGMEKIIDTFEQRITSLEENVLPMHEVNGKLQVKQHNIQRLINTIDATIQFYGKSNELESSIKEGSPSLNLAAYLENMECLQQSINFFENHPNYQTQTENMKMTMESGFTILEREYKHILQKNTVQASPLSIITSLDENFELLGSKSKDIKTIVDMTGIVTLGTWLLDRGRSRFLNHYSDIRGDNMMKTINAVLLNHSMHSAKLQARTTALKTALKKTSRAEKVDRREEVGAAEEGALVLFGCLLSLLEVEEGIMQKAIVDTSKRAQVFREVVSKPLSFVVRHVQKVVQESDAGVLPLLPLLRFLATHQTRLNNLANNSMGDVPFESLVRLVRMNASAHINEFVENLRTDSNKFVPLDGNVHPITSHTLNFLTTLTAHRHTVTQQLLSMTAAPGDNHSLLLPKLFARILSALGTSLKRKAELYDDATLSVLFLLNNNNYIAKALSDNEAVLLPVINEQNTQILSFYHSEINKCIKQYMNSWNTTLSTLQNMERAFGDKTTLKSMANNFIREFDQVCVIQRSYCISDAKLAEDVRAKVRSILVPPYSSLLNQLSATDKQSTRYTEESLVITINRLFDVTA